MKKTITTMFIILVSLNCFTQEQEPMECESPVEFGVDIYSRYLWRGLELNNAPNIQPWMTVSWKGLSLTTWGSYATSKDFTEVDLSLSYEISNFTFTINDYFNPFVDTIYNKYLDWKPSTTTHAIEFMTCYDLPFKKFPLHLTAGIFFYGDDKNDNDENYYSTYLEALYPFTVGKNEIGLFAGATFNEGYYADKAAVVNVGVNICRKIKVTENFGIPINGSFVINPKAETVFLVFGFSF